MLGDPKNISIITGLTTTTLTMIAQKPTYMMGFRALNYTSHIAAGCVI